MPFFLYENFEEINFNLAQSDDERIAVENVTKAINPDSKISAVSQNLIS